MRVSSRGEFDGRTDDANRIGGRNRMTDAFAIVHRIGDRGGGKQKGIGAKVGRKEGREAKQSIMKGNTVCGNGVLRIFAVVLRVVGVLVIWRIRSGVFVGGRRPGDGTSSTSEIVLELSRRLETRFLYEDCRSGGCPLIYREGELHALDSTRAAIEVGLARTVFLCSALLDDVGWMVALETGGFQLFNAPEMWNIVERRE
jgi:hypothetical protein